MSYNIGTLGLPIVLLGSLWGAVNTTLKFYEVINERRDQVYKLIDKCGVCPDITLGPMQIYFTNMMLLTIAACLFLVLICYVTTSIPKYMDIENEIERGLPVMQFQACLRLVSSDLSAVAFMMQS